MAGEILADASGDLLQSGSDVLVHGFDDIFDSFALSGLVMLVTMRPHGGARVGIEQLDFERKARHQIRLIHFGNVPEVATNDVVAAHVAAEGGNRAILTSGT